MRLTVEEVIKACGGIHSAQRDADAALPGASPVVTGVSTDSRTVKPGDLFVPIAGVNYDGHAYIRQALSQGAVCILTERDLTDRALPEDCGAMLVRVRSTRRALLDLAAYRRGLFKGKVVAITGSAGKTSTKDMIASVLAQQYKTHKTEGNYNNDIGLPLTVFTLEDDDEALVLEMGMNHFGEIHALSLAAQPDIAVITNIGDAHIENLGSREGILQAKLEITDGLRPHGAVVINGDDPMLAGVQAAYDPYTLVKCCICNDGECGRDAVENDATVRLNAAQAGIVYVTDIQPLGYDGTYCRLHIQRCVQKIHLSQPGMHMVTNALLAAAVGDLLGISPERIAEGIEACALSQKRMAVIRANGLTVIDDTYNANPASVRAAVEVLSMDGSCRRVCVLGDMLELGERAENLHRELGRYIAQKNIEVLIAAGGLARFIYDGYAQEAGCGQALYFDSKAAFLRGWRDIIHEGDAVLVKASRGMVFEDIVSEMTQT